MILVTGANGFVGHKIMQLCPDTVASPSLRGMTEEDIRRMHDVYIFAQEKQIFINLEIEMLC